VRHALRTKLGVTGVFIVLALIGAPTLLGVGGTSAKDARTKKAGNRSAAGAPVAAPVHADRHGFPFTGFDLFLLTAGGAVLLVAGANADRRRRPHEAPAAPREVEA
jgi:hypothetical protein